MSEMQDLIKHLEEGIRETMAKIDEIPDAYLEESCRHGCARGGTVWSLLTHNIEHERMHHGNVVGIRDSLRKMQQDPKSRLMAEYYVARATLIASLFGLDDASLDETAPPARWAAGRWTIREELEHVLQVDRDSISDMAAEYRERLDARP